MKIKFYMIIGFVFLNFSVSAEQSTEKNVINEKVVACESPSFMLKNECWRILTEGQDCKRKPIIMELEDQPIYCPEHSIIMKKGELDSLKHQKEAYFLTQLEKLKTKNIEEEIQGVIAMHSYYLLGYQINNKQFVTPGVVVQDQGHCRIVNLEGFGDVIYGKNHLAFRKKLISYASEFNQALIEFCK